MAMALKIMPHGRLQEWVDDEKGYFTAEGLEYSFVLTGDSACGARRSRSTCTRNVTSTTN
jgi:hypothetical protein